MTKGIQSSTIIKNTLYLYGRMFITIMVSLYTSRIVLNVLGVSDFGIYNVVGGIVTMISFLNVGMNQASSRFISYALGKNDEQELKISFGTCVFTHLTIATIVFVIAEVVGVWFLNTHLNIPQERMTTANWIFQFSIITFILTINTVPYTSCIISHEHMDIYAYISIVDCVLKLVVVLCLYYIDYDKLLIYGTCGVLISIINTGMTIVYARKKFRECKGKVRFSGVLYRKMFSFAGWGMIGNMGFSTKDQGSNVILNLFFGTMVNGARGVAGQVNGIISGFASNFTTAMNPQIIKLYASGDKDGSKRLVLSGAKLAFYLMSFIAIPFLVNVEYLLSLWLVKVPEYTTIFVTIILLATLIYSLSHTLSTAIAATGHFKWFQISLAILLLSELPIAYIILKMGGTPYHALLPYPITCFLSLILRIVIMHHYEPHYSYSEYMFGCVFRCILVFCISFAFVYSIHRFLPIYGFSRLIISILFSIIINGSLIYLLGITKAEQTLVLDKLKLLKNKIKG